MATTELKTVSTEELFGGQAPEPQTVSTDELFGEQGTPAPRVNPQSDEKISTQQEEPIGFAMANRVKDFFFASDTTNQRFQTSYEIAQEFDIPLAEVYDDKKYSDLVESTFSTPKRGDKVFSEVLSTSFMAAVGAGLVTNPVAVGVGLAKFFVASEVVSLALSSEWEGLKPTGVGDYKFGQHKTLADTVPKNSAPWTYAVAEGADFLAKAYVAGVSPSKVKKGFDSIFARHKQEMAVAKYEAPKKAPERVGPKELPVGKEAEGLPNEPIRTGRELELKMQPEPTAKSTEQLALQEGPKRTDILLHGTDAKTASIIKKEGLSVGDDANFKYGYSSWGPQNIYASRDVVGKEWMGEGTGRTVKYDESVPLKIKEDAGIYTITSAEDGTRLAKQLGFDSIDELSFALTYDSSPESRLTRKDMQDEYNSAMAVKKKMLDLGIDVLDIQYQAGEGVLGDFPQVVILNKDAVDVVSETGVEPKTQQSAQKDPLALYEGKPAVKIPTETPAGGGKPPIPPTPIAKDGLPNEPIPSDRLPALNNTALRGAKTSLEVREKIALDLDIPTEELALGSRGIGWTARWQSDGHLVDSHPLVEWGVRRLTERKVVAEERKHQFTKVVNDLAKRARKGGRKRLTAKEDPTGVTTWQKDVRPGYRGAMWNKLVPTDDLVFDFLESTKKPEMLKTMTPEEQELAWFAHAAWERMFDLAWEAEKINSKLDDYAVHIRRNLVEAWKATGDFGLAFRESRDNFLHDLARFRVKDSKTGKRLPFEKSFRYAQERTGKAIPTKNIAKGLIQYQNTFEDMMAYNEVIPAVLEGIKSIKPAEPTYMEEHAYKMLEKFVGQWSQNKRGIPADWAVDPQSEFAFWLKAARTFVSIMDLGLNPIIGTAAAVGEGSMNYMALGPKKVKLGLDRGLTPEGKAILKKYESWTGRSPWVELKDAAHQITDNAKKTAFAFFATSAVEANKHGLLGSMTKEEFESGNITTERLAEIKLLLNRHRYQEGMESIVENTVEGKFFGQYKFSWGLPPLVSALKNGRAGWKKVFNGKKMTDNQKFELRRMAEMTLIGLFVAQLYYPDKNDQSVSAKTRRKISREQFTVFGALQIMMAPGSNRLSGLNLNVVSGLYQTFMGMVDNSPELIDKGIKKLKGVVVPSALRTGMDMLIPKKIEPPKQGRRTKPSMPKDTSYREILEDLTPTRR